MRYVLLMLLAVAGCSSPIESIDPFDHCVAEAAYAYATNDSETTPEPDKVPYYKDCRKCYGKGKVGDGRTMTDCPACDYDGDGDPNDSMNGQVQQAAAAPIWHTSYAAAKAESLRTGKDLVIVLSTEGCGPCVQLKRDIEARGNLPVVLATFDANQRLDNGYLAKSWFKTKQYPSVFVWRNNRWWPVYDGPEDKAKLDKALGG